MKLSTLLAFFGALPLPARSANLPDWKKPFATLFLVLHESRRRQAERHILRHQHLLDRDRARSTGQEASSPQQDDKTAPGVVTALRRRTTI